MELVASSSSKKVKRKDIPVTGRGGPYGCETSRFPHFQDSGLTDGGEVVSLTHRRPFTSREIPGTRTSRTPLAEGEYSASRPGRFTRERAPGTHRIEDWVDPRAGLDDLEKRRFLTPPGLDFQPVASRYTD
jgi:hypothetical protein